MISKVILFAFVLIATFFGVGKFSSAGEGNDQGQQDNGNEVEVIIENEERDYLPTTKDGKIVNHKYYSLSYAEKYEQAEWVAYVLTKKRLKMPMVPRSNDFRPDPLVETHSADLYDYKRSGYDRGHLVPAADMAFNQDAMSETFFFSNISPQAHHFNGGVWRELEELTRYWAKRFKRLYVVSGPIFGHPVKKFIGHDKVAVPKAYFKVLMDIDDPELKAIGYIIPNHSTDKRIHEFAVTVDEVERVTGFDFYNDLIEDDLEEQLESRINKNLWPVSDKKYRIRVEKWNLH